MDGPVGLSRLVVLGATGSIGRQTLEVADQLGIEVVGLATGTASPALVDLARRHPEAKLAVADDGPDTAELSRSVRDRVQRGSSAITALAATPGTIVVNGIVGAAGLAPTVAALEAGNRVALANKESLVAGGPVVEAARRRGGGELIPVDSEHSAVYQCLRGEDLGRVRRITLTASGGPFRGRTLLELADVGPAEALDHPTWNMGPRITVDSATLMNKAFEVIEAHHLFGVDYDRIDVVVHPQSVVHALVEFVDGVVKAEVGEPDMRIPIQYAITHPERTGGPRPPLDLGGVTLTFEPPDVDTFRCLRLGYEAGRAGGGAPAVLNAADEVAVEAFLDGRLAFLDIPSIIERTLDRLPGRELTTVDEVLALDAEARRVARSLLAA